MPVNRRRALGLLSVVMTACATGDNQDGLSTGFTTTGTTDDGTDGTSTGETDTGTGTDDYGTDGSGDGMGDGGYFDGEPGAGDVDLDG